MPPSPASTGGPYDWGRTGTVNVAQPCWHLHARQGGSMIRQADRCVLRAVSGHLCAVYCVPLYGRVLQLSAAASTPYLEMHPLSGWPNLQAVGAAACHHQYLCQQRRRPLLHSRASRWLQGQAMHGDASPAHQASQPAQFPHSSKQNNETAACFDYSWRAANVHTRGPLHAAPQGISMTPLQRLVRVS